MVNVNKKAIDDYFSNKQIKLMMFRCRFVERVSLISRLAYDVFEASNPRHHQKIVDYIWNEHIPLSLHNKWS